jgi:hypothetical protein
MPHAKGRASMEGSERPDPQVEAQQIKRVTFFREGEGTGWRPGRVGDIPDDGMGCSTQTIRSTSFERLA